MLEDLEYLVSIESPSHDIPAITRSAAAVRDVIERRLGRHAELVDSEAGPHVHSRFGQSSKVLIVGHHDTVFPIGALAARPFAVNDGRATGPGVFDMKAGIVLAVHALSLLDDLDGVELLITADEEVGSKASRALIEERALACGAVLVMEPSADGGALKTARKGTGTFEVVVHGRAAHAGLEPEKGINSLVAAAQLITRIATFGDPEKGTTVTPTVATAGTADNVVPALTKVRVDARVNVAGEKERVEHLMATLSSDVARCRSRGVGRSRPAADAGVRVDQSVRGCADGRGHDRSPRGQRSRSRRRQRRQLHRGMRRADARWARRRWRRRPCGPRVRLGRHDGRSCPAARRRSSPN